MTRFSVVAEAGAIRRERDQSGRQRPHGCSSPPTVLAGPLVEIGASLRAHFDEVPGRPALAAGGFAADRVAAGPVEDQIPWIGFAEGVDDETVLVTVNPGEMAWVVVCLQWLLAF